MAKPDSVSETIILVGGSTIAVASPTIVSRAYDMLEMIIIFLF